MGDRFRVKKEILMRSLKCANNKRIIFLRIPPIQRGPLGAAGLLIRCSSKVVEASLTEILKSAEELRTDFFGDPENSNCSISLDEEQEASLQTETSNLR